MRYIRDAALMPVHFVFAVVETAWILLIMFPIMLVGALVGAVAFIPVSLALAVLLLPFALVALYAPEWVRVPLGLAWLAALVLLARRR